MLLDFFPMPPCSYQHCEYITFMERLFGLLFYYTDADDGMAFVFVQLLSAASYREEQKKRRSLSFRTHLIALLFIYA